MASAARLLHQIGVLEAVEKKCTPMNKFITNHPTTGKHVLNERWFDVLREKYAEMLRIVILDNE